MTHAARLHHRLTGCLSAIPLWLLGAAVTLGPGDASKIQIRVQGPDRTQVRTLANQVQKIMEDDGGLMAVQQDWRTQTKVLRPIINEVAARANGIDRPDVARVLQEAFDGTGVGVFREGKDLIPIISRPPLEERSNVEDLNSLQIFSPAAGKN